MKKTIFAIALTFVVLINGNVFAQAPKLENIVNEQFGTLLESLLKDGKIDEISAKTYLETVFGYDEAVSNYLQTVNLTQQLKGLGQGKMSLDSYLTNLNSSLISLIPQEKQQAYLSYMQTHYMMEGAMSEIKSGKIGANTAQLASGIIQGIKDNKATKLKNEAIAGKLQVITPTLAKLSASNIEYKKLKIIDELDSDKNWNINTNPSIVNKPDFPSWQFTTNYTALQGGSLFITTQNYVGAVFNWDKETKFEPSKSYKNLEKFDFSKDFVMNLHVAINEKTDLFKLEIGKGYQLSINPKMNGTYAFVNVPLSYQVTEVYGKLNPVHNKSISRKILATDKERRLYQGVDGYNGSWMSISRKKNPDLDFENGIKISITKKGQTFTCKINDLPYELSSEVSFFPDKYYLGFLVNSINKKAVVQIQKIELEHL